MSYIVQQVRSTEEGRRPHAEQLAEGQLAVNVHNASPGVFLRTTTDKVVKVGGTSVGPTTPFVVYNNEYSIGELWFNTTDNDLKVFDGENFVSSSSSVKALADFKAGAPSDLLTLKDVATALGNDPDRSVTVDTRFESIEAEASTLSNLVDSNDLARQIGQGALQTALDDEAVIRAEADTEIETRLAVLEAANPWVAGDADTLSDANAYTDTAIAGLVGTAGEGFDTLGEISDALSGDTNFAVNTQAALDLKAPIHNPVFTGGPQAPTVTAGTNNNLIATTAFVQTAVNNLISGAPGALDTLNELADALGDDDNFATTITSQISAIQDNVSALVTLAGVSEGDTDLGTFISGIIPANSTIKDALQSVETDSLSRYNLLVSSIGTKASSTFAEGLETNIDNLVALTGVAKDATDLGDFSGTTITSASDIKTALQELETAVESAGGLSNIADAGYGVDVTGKIATSDGIDIDIGGSINAAGTTVDFQNTVISFTGASIGGLSSTIRDDVDSHLNQSTATDGQILSWDASANGGNGDYAWVDDATAAAGGGIASLVDDTTPELGGDLDLNGNNIVTGTGRLTYADSTSTVSYFHLAQSSFAQPNSAVLSSVKSIHFFLDSNGGDSGQAFRIYNNLDPDNTGAALISDYIFQVSEAGNLDITGTLNGHTIPGGSGTLALTTDVSGSNFTWNASLIPDTNAAYDLGSAEYKVRHLFLSDNSIKFGDAEISLSVNEGDLEFGGIPVMPRTLNHVLQTLGVASYDDNAAAVGAGLAIGDVYYNTTLTKLTSVTA